jgi:hypothetical protein
MLRKLASLLLRGRSIFLKKSAMLKRSGLGYDKQNNKVQTLETNEFLSLIHSLSMEIDEIKNGDSIKNDQISALVTSPGFKPGTSRAVI